MNLSARLSLATAALVLATGAASAATISLASYGSTNTAPTGVSNSALLFNGSSPTYDVPTGGIWANPVAGSSWVSFNPNTYPGGSVTPPNGIYDYTSTFMDLLPASSTGTITVMADDTTSVYLNSTLITPEASAATAGRCTIATPNCTTPETYVLTGFVSGLNSLYFDVHQEYNFAEGVDFAGTVATTPEPSSLLLLGTGLIGSAGALVRRMRA